MLAALDCAEDRCWRASPSPSKAPIWMAQPLRADGGGVRRAGTVAGVAITGAGVGAAIVVGALIVSSALAVCTTTGAGVGCGAGRAATATGLKAGAAGGGAIST